MSPTSRRSNGPAMEPDVYIGAVVIERIMAADASALRLGPKQHRWLSLARKGGVPPDRLAKAMADQRRSVKQPGVSARQKGGQGS